MLRVDYTMKWINQVAHEPFPEVRNTEKDTEVAFTCVYES